MYILGINFSHHGSICLLKDGEVVLFLEEERLSHIKYGFIKDESCNVLSKIKQYTNKLDYIVFAWPIASPQEYTGIFPLKDFNRILKALIKHPKYPEYNLDNNLNILSKLLEVSDSETKFSVVQASHHELHAAQAFYASGFTDAICVVVDGQGSSYSIENTDIWEKESIWEYSYNNNKQLHCNYNIEETGIGNMYSQITRELGFNGGFEEGKTMGLSSYKPHYMEDPTMMVNVSKANVVQKQSQEAVLKIILHGLTLSKSKNVCISGGYGLNCVANYYYRKNLPPDINLYCEPVANDAGQSIGVAKFMYHKLTNDTKIKPQTSICLGPTPRYCNDTLAQPIP